MEWVTENLQSDYELIGEGTQNVTLSISNLSREDNGEIDCVGKNSVWRSLPDELIQINCE